MATAPQIKVETGIPFPSRQGGPGNVRFPFAELNVGDSFHVPWGDGDRLKLRSVISNAMSAFQLRNSPKKLSARKDELGIRVWRVA